MVLARVDEYFPLAPGAVIRGVQMVWSRVLPPVNVPHVRLSQALEQGRANLAAQPGSNSRMMMWRRCSTPVVPGREQGRHAQPRQPAQ